MSEELKPSMPKVRLNSYAPKLPDESVQELFVSNEVIEKKMRRVKGGWMIPIITVNTRPDNALIDTLMEVLSAAQICIAIHSERLGIALNDEGNSEPQYACEATYVCDKIEEALAEAKKWKGEV